MPCIEVLFGSIARFSVSMSCSELRSQLTPRWTPLRDRQVSNYGEGDAASQSSRARRSLLVPSQPVERSPETLAFRDPAAAASRKMATHRESMTVPAAVPETGNLS
jgi:hypothetical protein